MHHFSWTEMPMPDTVIQRMEQLATQDQQPAALDFTCELGVEVGDLPPSPYNEVENDTRYPTIKVVTVQGTEQQMENSTNDDDPCETEESNYIDKYYNQLESTDGGVPET